jgi:hypothetical protein
MSERLLYRDFEMTIDALPNSPEDHYITFHTIGHKDCRYIIQRGVLRELATTSRDGLGSKMMTSNESMVRDAKERGLSVDALGVAIAQAFLEEDRRYQEEASEMRWEMRWLEQDQK